MFEQELEELKEFIESLECVKEMRGHSGPVQDTPAHSKAREMNIGVMLPLPRNYRNLNPKISDQIMEEVKNGPRLED